MLVIALAYAERTFLSENLNCPKHKQFCYAKIAGLLRCRSLTLQNSRFLIQTGRRCIGWLSTGLRDHFADTTGMTSQAGNYS